MVDKLTARLDKSVKKMEEMTGGTRQANKELDALDRKGQALQQTIGKLASAFAMKELVSKVTSVRGEFQQLEVAFRTMLGSVSEADALLEQLTRTAATTPFGLEDVAQGAKQLLAYGLAADQVNGTLVRLGDIAAGLSVPLNDLVYLYGTTMAQGRLYTQDLNQFTGRGIPMIQELARQFGVAESKVKELVEAGKVGFPEVQKVIESLTDEGGRFGGLMEAQSRTITGQISNIEDALTVMMNEVGQQSEGAINTALSGVSYLVEHYERMGRVLLGLVGTYGVYRTALITVTAAKGWATAAEALHYNWLVLVERAQKLLNATMLKNPYVLVATLIAGVVAAMVSMKTEAERVMEADEAYEAQKRRVIDAEEKHRQKMEELCAVAGNEAAGTDTRREALRQLEQQYPDIFAKYDTEYEKLKHIKQIKEEIAMLDGKRSITNTANELHQVEARIAALEAKKATARWEDQNGSGTRMRKTGGLTRGEEAELKSLQNRRTALTEKQRKDAANAYFENLTGVSNETLAQQVRQRERLLAAMTVHEKQYGRITTGEVRGTYSADELKYQLNKLRSEQNRRKETRYSSQDLASGYRKRYQDALKAYDDFVKETSNQLTKAEFEQKAKELKDAVEVAKKEYDQVRPESDKEQDKQRKQLEKAEREADKRRQMSEKLGEELAALQRENDAAEIDAMEEGLQKKLRQIDNDYAARKAEIGKQEAGWRRDNAEAGMGDGLTPGQQEAIGTANDRNEQQRRRAVADAYREEFASMQASLRQYGSYQQRKLAIAEEYAEKIRKATTDGERRMLETERDRTLTGVASQELQTTTDWSMVMGEFGRMFRDVVAPELEKAKEYVQTEAFRNSDAASQDTLLSAIRQMEQQMGSAGEASFRKLGADLNAYRERLAALGTAQDAYKESYRQLTAAQQAYLQAVEGGTEAEREAAEAALHAAEQQEAASASSVDILEQGAEEARRAMSETATTLRDGMDGVVDGLRQLASGSVSGAYEGLVTLGKSADKIGGKLGDAMGSVADALEDMPIVDWIAEIVDLLKDGISVVVEGLLDTVFGAVIGILDDVLSGDLAATFWKSVVDGVAGIFDALTWGGFTSWFDTSNAKEVQATIDRLTERNELLQGAVEDLTDELKASKGTKSVAAYRDAYQYQQETNANLLQMAQAQAGYHGSHHSWNYYWGGFSEAQIAKLGSQIGRQWNGDLWDLSPEEMKVLRSNVDMWEQIRSSGKGGYGESVADRLDDYIEQAGKLEELTDQLYAGLTGITFDGLYDSFVDQLMDMDATAEDFADNVSEYFMRAMLSNQIGELYSDKLKEWWGKFGKAMEDNDLTEAERKALQDEYMGYVEEAMKLRDDLAKATGYDKASEGGTKQSAKAGGFTAMTQDQGTKLEGLFTSGLQHWSSMDSRLENVVEKMSTAEGHLARIEEHTGKSAARLEDIADGVARMLRDGVKVK